MTMVSLETILTTSGNWMVAVWCDAEPGDFLVMLATAHLLVFEAQ
jgi:hypothetical protein